MPANIFLISFSVAWLILFQSSAILILRWFWWARKIDLCPAHFKRITSFLRNRKDPSFFLAFETWTVSFFVQEGTVHVAKFLYDIFIILSCLIGAVKCHTDIVRRFWWAWNMFFGQHDSVFRAYIPKTKHSISLPRVPFKVVLSLANKLSSNLDFSSFAAILWPRISNLLFP